MHNWDRDRHEQAKDDERGRGDGDGDRIDRMRSSRHERRPGPSSPQRWPEDEASRRLPPGTSPPRERSSRESRSPSDYHDRQGGYDSAPSRSDDYDDRGHADHDGRSYGGQGYYGRGDADRGDGYDRSDDADRRGHEPRRVRYGSSTSYYEPRRSNPSGDTYRPDDRSNGAFPASPRGGFGNPSRDYERAEMDGQRRGKSPHRGVGPKGYRRTDERIQEDVCEALCDADIDVRAVDVSVSDGVVTLSGEVSSREDKYTLEQIADRCSGVRDIENRVRLSTRNGSEDATSQRADREPAKSAAKQQSS